MKNFRLPKLLTFLIALACLSLPAGATITLTHTSTPTGSGGGSPISYTVTTSTGNISVVGIVSDTGVTVTGCHDNNGGNSYALNATHGTSTVGNTWACYAFNTTAGITTITVTFTGTGSLNIVHYDLASSTGGAFDAINALSAQSSANPVIAVTAAGAGFCMSVLAPGHNTVAMVSGPFSYDAIATNGIAQFASASHVVNASGGGLSLPTTTISGTSTTWSAVALSIKESGGGGVTRLRGSVIQN